MIDAIAWNEERKKAGSKIQIQIPQEDWMKLAKMILSQKDKAALDALWGPPNET